MKHTTAIMLATLLSVYTYANSAFAGSLVCAGATLHHARVMNDFGAPPPQGLYSGIEFLSYRGDRLGFLEYFVDEEPRGFWPIEIEMSEHRTIITEGSLAWGVEISSDVLTIRKAVSGDVLASEAVICRREWAFVP